MKKHTTTFSRLLVAAAVTLLVFSCRKMDAELPEQQQPQTLTTPTASPWKSASAWNASQQEGQTVHTASFTDSTLSRETLKKALVLVYARSGQTVEALPFSKNGQSWYYQAAPGKVNIHVQGPASAPQTQLTYFIITEEKIKALGAQGHSKASLLSLTYETAQALLK